MATQVDIFGKNLEITEHIHDYVTKKVGKLDRYLTDIIETRVDLAFIKSARSASDRQVAQITVRGRGYILRTEERSDDLLAAVDTALDKMQRQIERFKGKRVRGRGDGRQISDIVLEDEEIEEIEEPAIVKVKRFALSPMDPMEALEQMLLLGHDNFFVFYNADTSTVNVLYRRRDGTYGLIEPEIA